MAEVVASAGGWIFDRVMAGWHVTVLVAECEDLRPLRILGVEAVDLESALRLMGEHGPLPRALAVAGDLYESDVRVRRGVQDTLDQHAAEVTLWGELCPSGLDHRVGSVQHQLSVAARAFKAQALAALDAPVDPIGDIETFRSSELLLWPGASDLIPAS